MVNFGFNNELNEDDSVPTVFSMPTYYATGNTVNNAISIAYYEHYHPYKKS